MISLIFKIKSKENFLFVNLSILNYKFWRKKIFLCTFHHTLQKIQTMPLFRENGIINATSSVLNSLKYKLILIKYIFYFIYFQQNSIIKCQNLLEEKVYAIDKYRQCWKNLIFEIPR